LFTALLLARQGISVKIVDSESRPTTHSYACALHPRTIQLFEEAGLLQELLAVGRRVETIRLYDGHSPCAELNLAKLPLAFPFLLVLPQSKLEELLERQLRAVVREGVQWNHHLVRLNPAGDRVVATVDRLGPTVTGYIVPHWETVVMDTSEISAAFVVGADGHNSFVRAASGIEYRTVAPPELFVVYEFDSDTATQGEARIVLGHSSTSVLWPLPDGRCRWSFQWPRADEATEFPTKDRSLFWMEEGPRADRTQAHLKELIHLRAPWFTGSVEGMDWAIDVQFERRLATQFGQGRCWLVGDAAHQTGPVGVQSVNAGFREAAFLAGLLKGILREGASLSTLQGYDKTFGEEWQRLFGLKGRLAPLEGATPSTIPNPARLLSCLPASGEELGGMLKQLGFELK
jgi:2-polyprenyl-6-methoxyphenol hydroxylase-like FAD-dependent oxidoreductase